MSKTDKLNELLGEAMKLEDQLKIFYNVLDDVIARGGDDKMIEELDVIMPYLSERIKAAGELAEKLEKLNGR